MSFSQFKYTKRAGDVVPIGLSTQYNRLVQALDMGKSETYTEFVNELPVRLYIPINAFVNQNNQWQFVDSTKPAWAICMDIVSDTFTILHCSTGTNPIVWDVYSHGFDDDINSFMDWW